MRRIGLLAVAAAALCATLPAARADAPIAGWPLFHRDQRHSGVAPGTGNVNATNGPIERWAYQVTAAPDEILDGGYRWVASMPLGNLDGDAAGTMEIVVTGPDGADRLAGGGARVMALRDDGTSATKLWEYQVPGAGIGADQYSSALVDADEDGRPDVVFTTSDGVVRAIKGNSTGTGVLLWSWATGRLIESGPTVADLDGDSIPEVIVPADCISTPARTCADATGALYAFRAHASGLNAPIWSVPLPAKSDSGQPTIDDLDPGDGRSISQAVFGSWDAKLRVVWRDPDTSTTVVRAFDLCTLRPCVPGYAAVRTSPLLVDWSGNVAVFGWMPDWRQYQDAYLTAMRLHVSTAAQTVTFTPLWTITADIWKSSPALFPVQGGAPSVVAGYGVGQPGASSFWSCEAPVGGLLLVEPDGTVAWESLLRPGRARSAAPSRSPTSTVTTATRCCSPSDATARSSGTTRHCVAWSGPFSSARARSRRPRSETPTATGLSTSSSRATTGRCTS